MVLTESPLVVLPSLLFLLLPFALIRSSFACLSSVPNTCYSGQLFDDSVPLLGVEKCQEDLYRGWCAIRYLPNDKEADFHCASAFQHQLGRPFCGAGNSDFEINHSGCLRQETINGPCFFCCCRGPQCNNPIMFQREAQAYFPGLNVPLFGGYPNPNFSPIFLPSPFLLFMVLFSLI